MAENLRKLVSSESLRSMQDKLELWLREYNVSQGGRPPGLAPPLSPVQPSEGVLRAGIRLAALQSRGGCDSEQGPSLSAGSRGRKDRPVSASALCSPPREAALGWRGPRSAGLGAEQRRAQSL